MLCVTIPTAGNRNGNIEHLIATSGLPRQNFILIATRTNIDLPTDVMVVEDLGPINIQRWWNKGIDAAKEMGADAIAVLNDDVSIEPQGLQEMHRLLSTTSAPVASPMRPGVKVGLHKRRLLPYRPVLWGACWMLKVQSSLRPDERFRWWYGDDDLDIRARRDFGGILSVPIAYQHLNSGEQTGSSDILQDLARSDEALFEYQYRSLLKTSRSLRRWQRRLSLNPSLEEEK